MSIPLITKVEAILYLKARPLKLAEIAEYAQDDRAEVETTLKQLMQDYDQRNGALEVIKTPDGYSLQLRSAFQDLVKTLVPVDLGRGALRTLAAIALKGSISQTELVNLRGSGAYQHVHDLVEQGFVRKRRQKENRSYSLHVTEKFHRYFQTEKLPQPLETYGRSAQNRPTPDPEAEIPEPEISEDSLLENESPESETPEDQPGELITPEEPGLEEHNIPKVPKSKPKPPENKTPEDELYKSSTSKDKFSELLTPEDEVSEDEIPELDPLENEISEDKIPEDEVPEDEIPEDEIPEDEILEDEILERLIPEVLEAKKTDPAVANPRTEVWQAEILEAEILATEILEDEISR